MDVLFSMACIAISEKRWLKRVNNPSEHEKQIRKINSLLMFIDCNCGWNKKQHTLGSLRTEFENH